MQLTRLQPWYNPTCCPSQEFCSFLPAEDWPGRFYLGMSHLTRHPILYRPPHLYTIPCYPSRDSQECYLFLPAGQWQGTFTHVIPAEIVRSVICFYLLDSDKELSTLECQVSGHKGDLIFLGQFFIKIIYFQPPDYNMLAIIDFFLY